MSGPCTFTFASSSTNNVTMSKPPLLAAKCRGVLPIQSCIFKFAPFSNNSFTVLICHSHAAQSRSVPSCSLWVPFTFALFSYNNLTTSICFSFLAAKSRGVPAYRCCVGYAHLRLFPTNLTTSTCPLLAAKCSGVPLFLSFLSIIVASLRGVKFARDIFLN
jgi:hypothetical protein